MTKPAVKERNAEPALFADMKDVTPKKGDKKPEPEKKPAKAKQASKAVAVATPQRAAKSRAASTLRPKFAATRHPRSRRACGSSLGISYAAR